MANMDSGHNNNLNILDRCIIDDELLIGYPAGMPHNKADMSVDELAEKNSYTRDFLNDGISENIDFVNDEIKNNWLKMIKGELPHYDKLGVQLVSKVKSLVRSDYYKLKKPNSQKTILAKTSKAGLKKGLLKDKPLIDTGQMINNMTYTVEYKR